jgi:hypothetical protein
MTKGQSKTSGRGKGSKSNKLAVSILEQAGESEPRPTSHESNAIPSRNSTNAEMGQPASSNSSIERTSSRREETQIVDTRHSTNLEMGPPASSNSSIERTSWAQRSDETFQEYVCRFIAHTGPILDGLSSFQQEQTKPKRRKTSLTADAKNEGQPVEEDDVVIQKPLLLIWRAYFKAFLLSKDPFPSHEKVRFMLEGFKKKLQEAKTRLDLNDEQRAQFLFLGYKPGALLRANTLQVFAENADEFSILSFEKNGAFKETTQSRSGLVKKLRNHIESQACQTIISVDQQSFSTNELAVFEDFVEKAKAFLLCDFEMPRADVEDQFPNLWALVALVFDNGPISSERRDHWKRMRRKICESREDPGSEGTPVEEVREEVMPREDLEMRVAQSFTRVLAQFQLELGGEIPDSYESFVGEWCVLTYSLLTVVTAIEGMEELAQSLRSWAKRLWSETVGDPRNLLVKELTFSEVLACRWALKQLGFSKVPRDVHESLLRKAADPRALPHQSRDLSDHDETVSLVWAFFCQELGFPYGDLSGKDALQQALEKFEDNFEERLDDLCAGDGYLNCPQAASNLWTFSFWVTHYVYVRTGYAMRRLQVDSALETAITKACLKLACVEESRQAPDCLAELVHCVLMVRPGALKEVVPHIERLLEMESEGNLVREETLEEDRQTLHGRFVFLLALGTFLVVARRPDVQHQ